jgi:thiol-disulfide isomerase/thioredoxin
MTKRNLIPFALILILLLAACSGSSGTEANRAEAADMPETVDSEMMEDSPADAMDDASNEGMDDEMMNESADEAMDDASNEGMDDGMMEESSDDAMDDGMHDEMMDENADEAMDDASNEGMDDGMMAADMVPAWQTIALTNAATGETFTLGDFQGKTVFVEPMATWCSNCRAQQGEVREAKTQLGDDVVFIGLSLETNLPSEQLASYAQDNGFDWTYAVMPVDLLSQLADQFGRSITNAPSTPHFIIRPDGTFSDLSTGIDPADTIVAKIQAEQG